ncbi:ubiquinol oxidase subunit II [Asticcacaulis benevestitus]|uniref:Ubiquinol oxidase subunit 2 n=1 Tax=Asticcacaulis benevestitus DSM 16100 = ATCC BAA-896 TaxID=1121022 RepID=V4NWW5_9CAUL|nr:ubiquinol oxidase subunit II [Asticcacaulis benevestitus]ESQ79454.1 hypothetical protein ABENE_22750 [Asticcacaulis benevestitus DSM 16100 = ATCC BAA-896]
MNKTLRLIVAGTCVPLLLSLSGCTVELLDPKGQIGMQEKDLILIALGVMLLVVIPVIILTLFFAWKYRESNTSATYAPTWAHSNRIEIVIWAIPCLIVLGLAGLIWVSTHQLDPYRPIASKTPPLEVQVVALNWKWLFIYPEYGIATVNQLEIPVDRPVAFKLTAESIMNSFFIPQLGSQVYAMAGMQTQLHLIANHEGIYPGRSAAFSGPGFSDMHFDTITVSPQAFSAWVAQAQSSPVVLDDKTYAALAAPSIQTQPTVYGRVSPGLFLSVVNHYMPARSMAGMDDKDNDLFMSEASMCGPSKSSEDKN